MDSEIRNNLAVYPIRIPTPFAVGDVFCYLIIDDKIVLVDTGHYSDDAFDMLSDGLQSIGIGTSDLDEIWLTHGHPDHFGQALHLSELSGAVVFGHPNERANFIGNEEKELFEEFFRTHNIPKESIRQMVDQLDWLQQYLQPIEPEWIYQGDELCSGTLNFEVHLTPGHAPGHLTFVSDQGIIFSGDLLLGHISTNALINFDPDTGDRNKSLLQYQESLQWIRQQESVVLPGHGKKIENISEVASHHLREHRKRYQNVRKLLSNQPMSLLELSYKMFPDAIKEGAVFLVLSEVLGYLDWGMDEGTVHLDKTIMKYSAAI